MIGAQHPDPVGEQPFEFGDRAADVPARPAPEGEVAAGGQGVGMIGAQHPLLLGEQPFEFGDRFDDQRKSSRHIGHYEPKE